MSKVSILLPVYNHAPYLVQALESIKSQTFGDFEAIVWDDGSTDDSYNVARDWIENNGGARFRLFQHENAVNRGQEATRNLALLKTSGQYICLLDSDDFWLPQKLAEQVQILDLNPDAGLAYGRCKIWAEAAAKYIGDSTKGALPEGYVFETLVRGNFISACTVMFRRSALRENAPFQSKYGAIGEFPLWLDIARRMRIVAIDQPLAVWRVHRNNTGTKRRLQGQRELVAMTDDLLQSDFNWTAQQLQSIRAAKVRYLYDEAMMVLESGKQFEAARDLFLKGQEVATSIRSIFAFKLWSILLKFRSLSPVVALFLTVRERWRFARNPDYKELLQALSYES